ncbi:hypothetical protein DINM_023002 [Dirofilaria immitis]|nr:hypothetical protein [Dirofilaria immitis]
MAISSPPPLYSPPSDDKAKSTLIQKFHYYPESKKSLQQPKYPLSTCFQKYDFPSLINPSTQSTVEPIIMPIVIPQTATAPLPCQLMSDKPVNVTVNANNKAEENSLAKDYRICSFCKCGIMEKKKYEFPTIPHLFILMS